MQNNHCHQETTQLQFIIIIIIIIIDSADGPDEAGVPSLPIVKWRFN